MKAKQPKIIDGIQCWQCPTCGKYLDPTGFYKSKRTANGLGSQCKNCHLEGASRTRNKETVKLYNRQWMRRSREAEPEKFKDREREASRKRPKNHKVLARAKLNNAVRDGRVIKPSACENCGRIVKLTAHHPDYSEPLKVVWLCYECHGNK